MTKNGATSPAEPNSERASDQVKLNSSNQVDVTKKWGRPPGLRHAPWLARPEPRKIPRRQFLSAALLGLSQKSPRPITGGFVFESQNLGHQIRDKQPYATPQHHERVPVVIIGGGMAGLSAAWRLGKRGFNDYVLLELEQDAGGNARWGENEISRYPWAAHYVPVPNKSSTLVRELFEEFGLLKNGHWDERHLCHSPQERLYLHGRWQDGLEPENAATKEDRKQYKAFEKRMAEFRATGQFTVPLELGAKPSPLDQLNFRDWLKQNQFTSPYLNWYADYSCRDDYGASSTQTSAWAGIHYFASREHEEKGPLTWPEGNGWIAKRLIEKAGPRIRKNEMARRIERTGSKWRVTTAKTVYDTDAVIFAAPSFLAPHLIDGHPPMTGFEYSPWLTANLTLDRMPAEQQGSERAWDNVIYNSPSLGYVVATHQSLASRIEKSVWTYYLPLAGEEPAAARKRLLTTDWAAWKEFILADLERAHPDIRQCVSHMDIFRNGHAMVRPAVGFLSNPARQQASKGGAGLEFANSDISGISIFEQAQYRGVLAADRILARK